MFFKKDYLPCARLAPYIASLTIIESSEAISFNTLPAITPVLAFHFKGKMFVTEQGTERALRTNGLFGMHQSYKSFRNEAFTSMLLVTFSPLGAGAFFSFPLHEIFAASYPLDHFIAASSIEAIEERLALAADHPTRIRVTEQFFLSILLEKDQDQVIQAAVEMIKAHKGNIPVHVVSRQLFLSESSFERRFQSAVGITAKKYASIIRVRSVISDHRQHPKLTALAYEAGYYDQAHFIKDFKSFTGLSPLKFFRNNTAPFLPI